MQIQSTWLGTLEIDPESILTFPQGIPGFEQVARYKLFHEDKEQPVVHWLQAVDRPDVTIPVVDPATLDLSYEIALSDAESALLQMQEGDPVAVMLVTYKPRPEDADEENVKVNISAPIFINTRSRRGIQKVLEKIRTRVTVAAA